ncbi:SLATT domain-containing protein [uncultured Photobacterium sp.]|uniref:SLATT domain-containing protein n=1 Tax=uncultured Photobacterium sp. TaxID=173973 RepID=UPI0026289A15|nr:SLATT domain-containing protein [uncultured Photobacterium sp.]
MSLKENLIKEITDTKERMLMAAYSHHARYRHWHRVNLILNITIGILGGVTGGSLLAQNGFITGFIAFIVAILASIAAIMEPAKHAESSKTAYKMLKILSSKLDALRDVHLIQITDDDKEELFRITDQFLNIREARDKMLEDAPVPSPDDLEKGRERYKLFEADISDIPIPLFPESAESQQLTTKPNKEDVKQENKSIDDKKQKTGN